MGVEAFSQADDQLLWHGMPAPGPANQDRIAILYKLDGSREINNAQYGPPSLTGQFLFSLELLDLFGLWQGFVEIIQRETT